MTVWGVRGTQLISLCMAINRSVDYIQSVHRGDKYVSATV